MTTFGLFPTPLQTFELGADRPPLLVKREDLCGVGFGGNKVRKLRALLTDARARGASTVLTWGGPQSNHCALTAVAGRMAGFDVELFFTGDRPPHVVGNQRVDHLLGARLHFPGVRGEDEMGLAMQARADELRARGQIPYLVPLGGSSVIGALTYVDAVGEVVTQVGRARLPHRMVVAAGSLGTLAGIIAGTWVHDVPTQVVGVSVLHRADEARKRVDALLEEMLPHVGVSRRDNYVLDDGRLGGGYGVPSEAGRAAAALAASRFGLMLEQTYTAKAFAGLLAGIDDGANTEATILYWHTGGTGGFFAENPT